MSDRARFMKQVFNIDNYSDVDLFCCVVAKHNICTQNKHEIVEQSICIDGDIRDVLNKLV